MKTFKNIVLCLGCLLFMGQYVIAQSIPEMPIIAPKKHTLEHEWSQKEVLKSKRLASTENLEQWEHRGNYGSLSVSKENPYRGDASLLLVSPTKGKVSTLEEGFTAGRPWGVSSAYHPVQGEDWSDWNRISFWVYPDLPGFRVVSLSMVFHNDGEEQVPGPFNRNGLNFQIVDNQQWNKVYWEFEHLGRDNVTGIEIRYRLQGNEPGATKTVKYYIDEVFLEKVKPDHYEGWNVAPGHIAYNHVGYVTDMPKTAITSDKSLNNFSLVNKMTNEVVFEESITTKETPIGTFQVMDFGAFNQQGTFILKAGDKKTNPFKIGRFEDVYRNTVIKTINHFYAQRCGYAVPGVHAVCHRDWTSVHGDKSVNINGGWHDAGDLSQGLTNTAEATHAQFALAHDLRHSDPKLSERLIKEGKWGLDWMLKTRFGDGYRPTWSTMDFWTDGIIGTEVDDVPSTARNSAEENLQAAKAEAMAAIVLWENDQKLAKYALESAEQDWQFAAEKIGSNPDSAPLAAKALNASLTLFEATGNTKYKNAAIRYGNYVLESQQQVDLTSDISLKGFFYRSAKKENILHYYHRGHEQDLVMGLVRLSKAFPNHANKSNWDNAIRLYANYYQHIATYTDPYFMIPAGIYDLNSANDEREAQQVKNGFQLSDQYYLKSFPTWTAFRGNSGTILSQAKGLATAANYLQDQELLALSYKQLDWHLGINPFNQSLMYGVGYRYAAQYSMMSGNLVGGLPVGVQTHFNRDVPYWPAENVYNWKEIWVHPSSRWLWIMTDFYK